MESKFAARCHLQGHAQYTYVCAFRRQGKNAQHATHRRAAATPSPSEAACSSCSESCAWTRMDKGRGADPQAAAEARVQTGRSNSVPPVVLRTYIHKPADTDIHRVQTQTQTQI